MVLLLTFTSAGGKSSEFDENLYDMGQLEPFDNKLKVKSGQVAPDFTLPSVSGKKITLSQYRDKKNVVISFVPAAWTPVCSGQWPGYNISKVEFTKGDAVLLGITVDNIPSLYAWTRQMGEVWFEVLSDFWPHGAVAEKYGLLRSDGLTERSLIFKDKKGIIRSIMVKDINKRPDMGACFIELEKLQN